jgi:DNA-binding winged helix-turn-helix (wHTH) protein
MTRHNPVNLGSGKSTASVIARYPRAITSGNSNPHITPHEDVRGEEHKSPNAGEVTMRASGSTALRRLPSSQVPAQFRLAPAVDVDVRGAVQSSETDRPFFERRTEPAGAAPTEVSFGPFRLLPARFLLLEGDKPVPLGSRALEILIVLLERPGELISKQELMARVWPNIFVEPANLTVHMSALRRALRDGQKGNRFIINIPGRGYCFVASVGISGHGN